MKQSDRIVSTERRSQVGAVGPPYDGSDSVTRLSPRLHRLGLFAPATWASDNLPRVARQIVSSGAPPPPPQPGSPLDRAMPPGIRPDAEYANRADVLTADDPSHGTMSARGVAWVYSALLGHVGGVSLVSRRRLAGMAAVAFTGLDEVMGFPSEWAFGYSPGRPGGAPSRPGSTFGMVGMNGSAAYADIDSGVAVAVMRNRFTTGDLTTVARIDHLVAETMH